MARDSVLEDGKLVISSLEQLRRLSQRGTMPSESAVVFQGRSDRETRGLRTLFYQMGGRPPEEGHDVERHD